MSPLFIGLKYVSLKDAGLKDVSLKNVVVPKICHRGYTHFKQKQYIIYNHVLEVVCFALLNALELRIVLSQNLILNTVHHIFGLLLLDDHFYIFDNAMEKALS